MKAGLTYYLVNGALVAFVVSAATQRRFLFLLRINARNTGLSELGAATVGMLFSALWIIEPAWTVVLAFPAAVIARSLQYIRQLESETSRTITSRGAKTPKGALLPEEQEITVPIASDRDICTARRHGRTLALQLGYSPTEVTAMSSVPPPSLLVMTVVTPCIR